MKVGKVRKVEPDEETGLTDAVIEIDARYAPLPSDTRAILRQKTLLGETYVELAPGQRRAGHDARRRQLPQGQVADTVQLDEILRTFDPQTRERFSTWLDQQGRAARGNGEAISDALGNLTPFAENTDDVLKVLRARAAPRARLVRDTGEVFEALSERQGQLRDLISNSNRVWEVTARRDAQLADTFRVLPDLPARGPRDHHAPADARSPRTPNPLIDQLRPAARELSPTLIDLDGAGARPAGPVQRPRAARARVASKGLPAHRAGARQHAAGARRGSTPSCASSRPIVDYLGLYKREIAALLRQRHGGHPGRGRAQTTGEPLHYLRTQNPINPEMMAALSEPAGHQPLEPLHRAGRLREAAHQGHLEMFGSYLCTREPRCRARPPPSAQWLPAELLD